MDNEQSSKNSSEQGELGQSVVNGLVREMLAEQRRTRRWGIFFKILFVLYLVALTPLLLSQMPNMTFSYEDDDSGFTALVDLEGVIANDRPANADTVVTGLRTAFEAEGVAAVILRINSPGGSPVQAGRIVDEIKRLRAKHPNIKLYAVLGDLCASGGYYVAAAADEIYADKASLVGSIGVILSSFGFVDALEKLGVERRVLHAGENKNFLDPFSPLKDEHREHVQDLLESVHTQFKQVVIEGRGERLTESDEVFSGLLWTGEQAVELGLVDNLGSAGYVAREIIGKERIVDFTVKNHLAERLLRELSTQITEKVTGGGLGNFWNSEGVR
ncbi:MAG: signal peptide peptidase SppA [Candidatus Eutrophobiaceae bacterium]